MTQYLIYFNQQWVGDHDEAWFRSRAPLANAVVEEAKAAGVYLFAGGLVEELDEAVSVDATSGEVVFTDGPFAETKEYLGGFLAVEVPDLEAAKVWGGKVAVACGWPQLIREFQSQLED